MKFVIKPADNSLDMLWETNIYHTIWKSYGKAINDTFHKLTGLDFQQRYITANVTKGNYGEAGVPGRSMTLPGDYASTEHKAGTLLHELAHRLLGGNALGPVSLGLLPDNTNVDPRWQRFEHRHIYLFLQDAVREVFGNDCAALCAKVESETLSDDYLEAWTWAMAMNFKQRQHAIKLLVAEALPRNRWNERDNDYRIPLKDPNEWFALLKS